jgi:hypothetical protein
MVVHPLNESGNLLGVANLPCQRAQRRRRSGTCHPAQQRLQEEGFVGRVPSPRARQAQHRLRHGCIGPPVGEEALSRVQSERDAVSVEHLATRQQRGTISSLGIPRQAGLQITAPSHT